MEFVLFDGGDFDEYNCVRFVEISDIFATQYTFYFGIQPFDRVYLTILMKATLYTLSESMNEE